MNKEELKIWQALDKLADAIIGLMKQLEGKGKPTERDANGTTPGGSLLATPASTGKGITTTASKPVSEVGVDAVDEENKKLMAKVMRALKKGNLEEDPYQKLIDHTKAIVRTRGMTWKRGESLFSVLQRAALPPEWFAAALWEKEVTK